MAIAAKYDKTGTSGSTPRPAIWEDVPDEQWNDWRWQLSNRLNSVEELSQVINLTDDEIAGLSTGGLFRVDITPYFASLIDPDDPKCPIRLQTIPKGSEAAAFDSMMADSLSEDEHSPVPGLVHRYPDRVLMLVTTQCSCYCRYCTRSRLVGDAEAQYDRSEHDLQIDYIANTPQVRDVLLSGGDPFTLPAKILEDLLGRLYEIPHVEILRIGTRTPIFLPQRVTPELVDMLRQFHPLWINVHVNHPKEMTPEVVRALGMLADAGIPLGNQCVLLAGINDCPNIQLDLVHRLVAARVRPYNLYQCDLVQGAGHFRTDVATGIQIIESLRGHTTGFAVPVFIVDAPGGGGKVPLGPNYMLSQSSRRMVIRNYEGFISTYTEPDSYTPHDAATCEYCQNKRDEGVQKGVSALVNGDHMTIRPEGFNEAHRRGRRGETYKRGERNFEDDYS